MSAGVQRTGPLQIAYVTETYPPEINGVANTVQHAVRWLRGRGHAVQLVRPRQPSDSGGEQRLEPAPEILTGGMPIPLYPDLRMGFARPHRLVREWRRQRPDLVHIATEGPLGWAALRAAQRLGIPSSSDFRTNFHLYSAHYKFGMVQPVALAYLRWFHNATGLTTVPTRALRASLLDDGFRNLAVVGRGVDTALFSPARRSEALRASWGAGPEDVVVLHVGRLAPEKNVGLALRTHAAIARECPRARLVLVGDGPARTAVMIAGTGAVFMGWRRGEELARCYASADLFVFPSMTETFGNVVLEALASGLVVVAYDHGAAGEHVRDGTDGLLARFGDPGHFIAQGVRAALDVQARNAMRREARALAERLGWEVILQGLERVLRQAAAARPAPAESAYAARPR